MDLPRLDDGLGGGNPEVRDAIEQTLGRCGLLLGSFGQPFGGEGIVLDYVVQLYDCLIYLARPGVLLLA
jgi:hypothetical protein